MPPGQAASRGKPRDEAPFLWVARSAWQCIQSAPTARNIAHNLLVYAALAHEQSKASEQDQVRVTKGALAQLTGLGKRSVEAALYDLEHLGLIGVTRSKINGLYHDVNAYVLLSTRPAPHAGPSRTACTTPHAPHAGPSRMGRQPSRAGLGKERETLAIGKRVSQKKVKLASLKASAPACVPAAPAALASDAQGTAVHQRKSAINTF